MANPSGDQEQRRPGTPGDNCCPLSFATMAVAALAIRLWTKKRQGG